MSIFSRTAWWRYAIMVLPVLLLAMVTVNFKSVHADILPVVNKSGTLTEDETWSAGSVYVLAGSLTVPNGVSLTIEPGAIVKYYFLGNTGINVAQGGTLNVNGTSADPVVFTSYQDDTAGGDTNGDGISSGGVGEYSSAVYVNGGVATIAHATFRSGINTIVADCRYITSPGDVSITDNRLNGQVELDSCGAGVVSMQCN